VDIRVFIWIKGVETIKTAEWDYTRLYGCTGQSVWARAWAAAA